MQAHSASRKTGPSGPSRIFFDGDDWTDVAITAASLDEPGAVTPESNVFLDERQPWVIFDETLRCYARFP